MLAITGMLDVCKGAIGEEYHNSITLRIALGYEMKYMYMYKCSPKYLPVCACVSTTVYLRACLFVSRTMV